MSNFYLFSAGAGAEKKIQVTGFDSSAFRKLQGETGKKGKKGKKARKERKEKAPKLRRSSSDEQCLALEE